MKTINEYKNRFNQLLESTMGNVKPLINEDDEKDPYSDLYGKTVTYKDSQSGVELKGTIQKMIMVEPNDIFIFHNVLYVTEPKEMGYRTTKGSLKLNKTVYDCKTKTFWITLYEYNVERDKMTGSENEKIGKEKTISTFTCKGLSDVLSQRYPCATDFSMNNDLNTPDNLV